MNKSSGLRDFLVAADLLAKKLVKHHDEVKRVLTKYETIATFEDEYERSLSTLAGFAKEFSVYKDIPIGLKISVFLPLNLPLYSLVLFGIAPSVFADQLTMRCPEVMSESLNGLVTILRLKELFPKIVIANIDRESFIEDYARSSNVVLFTGKHENAVKIQRRCSEALFIYNGGGVNPIVIFKNADLNIAAIKTFEMRMFNNGQDCAGSDVIFVHEKVVDELIARIRERLEQLKTNNTDPRLFVLNRRRYVAELSDWLVEERANVVLEGVVSKKRAIVEPIIVRKPLQGHVGKFHEFFAPVFYILTFSSTPQIEKAFEDKWLIDHSMYTSVFGWHQIVSSFKQTIVLHSAIVNDVEKGNLPYGGYGKNANFVATRGMKKSYPILISKEIVSLFG